MVQYSENPQTGNWADESVNPSIQGIIQNLQEQINQTQRELMNHQANTQNKLEQILLSLNSTHPSEKINTDNQEQDKIPSKDTKNRQTIKIKSPDKWSGPSDRVNVTAWISSVTNYLNHYSLLQRPEGVAIIHSLLKGDAITYYIHMTETMHREFHSAAEILEILKEWANPKYNQRNIRERMRSLRQTRNQPVIEYITEFQQLAFIVKNMSNEDQLINFTEGLDPRIRMEVAKAGDEISLDEAYRIATMCDQTNNYIYSSRTYQSYQSNTGNRGSPMDVDSIDKRGQRFAKVRLTNEEKERLKNSNGCYYCRKPNAGHTAAYCPEKTKRIQDGQALEKEAQKTDTENSTSEYDSEGYVSEVNLVEKERLNNKKTQDKKLFINKNNYFEPLSGSSSEIESETSGSITN